MKLINATAFIKEYIHFRKMFLGMEDEEIFNYEVIRGSAAEYAQAHSLGFDVDALHLIKALAKAKKASAVKLHMLMARTGATTCN